MWHVYKLANVLTWVSICLSNKQLLNQGDIFKSAAHLFNIFRICSMLQPAYSNSCVVYSTSQRHFSFGKLTQKEILISLATGFLDYCPTHNVGPSESHPLGKQCTAECQARDIAQVWVWLPTENNSTFGDLWISPVRLVTIWISPWKKAQLHPNCTPNRLNKNLIVMTGFWSAVLVTRAKKAIN